MAAEVWPVTDTFAAEIGDIDFSGEISASDWAVIDEAYATYSVLIFPNQRLSHPQHIAVAAHFGEIDHSMQKSMDVDDVRLPSEIADVSNLDRAGELMADDNRLVDFQRANRLWHTDSSFKRVPANASCLSIRSVPPVGGQTEFADARAAWDELDPVLQEQIDGRIALHSIATSRAKLGFEMTDEENASYPRVPQAMVRTHRVSGRRSIYIASHAGQIVGLPDDEARKLLAALMDHVTQPRFVYKHRWRADDLVIWDNRCALHRGRPFDDLRWKRDAQRATSLDIAPTIVQEGLELPSDALVG